MKLLGFIDYLVTPTKLEGFYRTQNISAEAEGLSIYLAGSLTIESKVRLFGIEETGGQIHFQQDGVDYIYLLEIDLATGLVEADPNLKGNKASDLELADRLMRYAIYDA